MKRRKISNESVLTKYFIHDKVTVLAVTLDGISKDRFVDIFLNTHIDECSTDDGWYVVALCRCPLLSMERQWAYKITQKFVNECYKYREKMEDGSYKYIEQVCPFAFVDLNGQIASDDFTGTIAIESVFAQVRQQPNNWMDL